MQVMRWMGIKEYEAFCKGKTLKNNTDWFKKGRNSSSLGFTFVAAKDPELMLDDGYGGIVDDSICATFQVDSQYLTESQGRYYNHDTNEDEWRTEYCTTTYSNKNFKLIKTYINWTYFYNLKTVKKRIKILAGLMRIARFERTRIRAKNKPRKEKRVGKVRINYKKSYQNVPISHFSNKDGTHIVFKSKTAEKCQNLRNRGGF